MDHSDQSIIYEKMPKGTSEIRHYHNEATQFFFILSGVLEIEIDGVVHQLGQHECIEVKPHTSHQVFNKSDDHVEFLVISHPNTKNDRVDL